MSTYIDTNTTASMASINLNNSNDALSNDIEQLSTGLRINSASDDPAGFVVMENMNAQLAGLNQATANSNDAINMSSTAVSSLTQVENLLTSMRTLAVQASNLGVNDSTDVEADQTQIASAIQSINNIAATTQFGNKFLLNGSATSAMTTTSGSATASAGSQFAVVSQGAWNSNDAYNYTVNDLSAITPANDTFATTGFTSGQTPATALSSATTTFGGAVNINGSNYNITGGSTLTAFNTAIASSGYQASFANNGNLVYTAQTNGPITAPTIDMSGLTVSGAVSSIAATGTSAGNVLGFLTAAGSGGALEASQASVSAATPITVSGTLDFTDTPTAGPATTFNKTYAAGTSINQVQTDLNSTFGNGAITVSTDAAGDLVFTQATATDTLTDAGSSFSAYNSVTPTASSTFTNGTNAALTLSDTNGHTLTSTSTQTIDGNSYYTFQNGLVLSSAVAPVTSGTTTVNGGLLATAGTTSIGQDLEFQIGANEGQTASEGISSVAADQLGTGAPSYTDANGNTQTVETDSVADINVTTFKGAQDAIAVLDQAINQVSTLSANLGAFQTNVLQSNVTSLGVASTNLQASQATVADTDMAATIVDYTKNSILVQAGTSALAYANQMPQNILKLLQ
jgi:flagellin-like hook-associated protein FlgL